MRRIYIDKIENGTLYAHVFNADLSPELRHLLKTGGLGDEKLEIIGSFNVNVESEVDVYISDLKISVFSNKLNKIGIPEVDLEFSERYIENEHMYVIDALDLWCYENSWDLYQDRQIMAADRAYDAYRGK